MMGTPEPRTGPSGRTPNGAYPYPIPDDTVDVPRDIEALALAIDPNAGAIIIGEVRTFGLAVAPARWLLCDGTAVEQATYPELYEAVGARFNTGGETQTQFRLPAVAGRAIVGAGAGSGLTARTIADRWGGETVQLSTNEIPSHAHGGATHNDNVDHSHYVSAQTGGQSTSHLHGLPDPGHAHGVDNLAAGNQRVVIWTSGAQGSYWVAPGSGYVGTRAAGTGMWADWADRDHSHGLNAWSGGASTRHLHGISAEGGSGAHSNMQPSIALLVCIYAGR
jgi:microcystin-dependent protein